MSARTRLSIMMFLQYFVWGSWGVSVGGYMGDKLHFSSGEITWIYSTTALGAMISPLLVGYIADRFFATEKILAMLHLVGGALLLAAGGQTSFPPLMTYMMAYAICFMPTLALTNSISFQNVANPATDFPRIRVWGTIGWIAAGLVVGILLGGTERYFFYLAAISSFVLSGYCLLLPHTPPRGSEVGGDVFGLGAIGLMNQPSFAVFAVCSLLICVPLAFYYNFANQFLNETDMPVPTALQTIGQISEIFFMAAMPLFIRLLGVKYMLLVGMMAWVARYYCFATLAFNYVILGLVLHGICYDFFFVASQIYVDHKAPKHLRASAQSLIAFITLGLGMFAGAKASGVIVNEYSPTQVLAYEQGKGPDAKHRAPLPAWAAREKYQGFWRYLDLSATIRPLLFSSIEGEKPPDFAQVNDRNGDRAIEVEELPEVWVEQKSAVPGPDDLVYDRVALWSVFRTIDINPRNGFINRAEWRAAQSYDWRKIWPWPALMAAVTTLLFMFGFHDRVEVEAAEVLDAAPVSPEP